MPRIAPLFLLLVLALSACQKDEIAKVGKAAPDLTVMTTDGNPVKLATLKGKVVFVNFWWSGCGPCLAEMPEIDKVYHRFGPEGFEVLSVNFGQQTETIVNTSRRLEVSYPLLSDRLKISAARYGVSAAPTSFLIDRDGVLREAIYGPVTQQQLAAKIEKLL